jgi:hypothetical protein
MANELELMRVLRVMPLGKLVVDVAGARYQRLSDVPEEEIRRRLVAAIGELIVFAGGYQVLLDAGVAPPLAVPTTQAAAVAQPAAVPGAPLSMEEQQARFLQSLEKQRDATSAAAPPRGGPNLLGGLVKQAPPPPPPPAILEPTLAKDRPLTIIEQIDIILQKHLAMDPQLSRRDIRMESALNGGLRIKIDGNYYEHPNSIPEKEVQLVIKMALKEWDST